MSDTMTQKEKAAEYDRLKEKQRAAHKKRNAIRNAKVKAWDQAVLDGKVDPIDVDSLVY